MNSLGHYGNRLPRYFITIDKDIVFDYPKDIGLDEKSTYRWNCDVSKISDLLEEYIQCPNEKLFDDYPNDKWGLVDILLACDRRVGERRLKRLEKLTTNEKVRGIIEKRRKANDI
jgi:hypothetical protein